MTPFNLVSAKEHYSCESILRARATSLSLSRSQVQSNLCRHRYTHTHRRKPSLCHNTRGLFCRLSLDIHIWAEIWMEAGALKHSRVPLEFTQRVNALRSFNSRQSRYRAAGGREKNNHSSTNETKKNVSLELFLIFRACIYTSGIYIGEQYGKTNEKKAAKEREFFFHRIYKIQKEKDDSSEALDISK